MLQYLEVLRIPDPSSSTNPISLKNLAIVRFLGYGEKKDFIPKTYPLRSLSIEFIRQMFLDKFI